MGVPQNGWFIMENLFQRMIWEYNPLWETSNGISWDFSAIKPFKESSMTTTLASRLPIPLGECGHGAIRQ